MSRPAKPKVVLFDVDETLVHTGGVGAKSWRRAFDRLHGVPADIGAHTSAGETDPEVARATFEAVLHRAPTADELGRLYVAYLQPHEIFVVGDTPLDVAAAKKDGVVAVAVASGHYSTGQLTGADADSVLASLEDAFPGL